MGRYLIMNVKIIVFYIHKSYLLIGFILLGAVLIKHEILKRIEKNIQAPTIFPFY